MQDQLLPGFYDSNKESYASLKAKASICVACPLALSRERVVFGLGCISRPLIAFVGTAPRVMDEGVGRPFSGVGGDVLREALTQIQGQDWFQKKKPSVDLVASCYYTNSVLCKPPLSRAPEEQEVNTCSYLHLYTVLRNINPIIIVMFNGVSDELKSSYNIGFNMRKLEDPYVAASFDNNRFRVFESDLANIVRSAIGLKNV